ncbi:MAG: TIR domain-containing protein [Deltaproteobacteria bacterium]|nr:TIR domain-containing protein [Deltaproteobacteria bacterium]
MSRFFISYARVDAVGVDAIVRALEFLGHDVWIDRELVGGHRWWDAILDNIRRADVFVAALSVDSLESKACREELGYARALGKVTLPILVGDLGAKGLPADLAAIRFVDYRVPEERAALALAKAVGALPPPMPLSNPLPVPPELGAIQDPSDNSSIGPGLGRPGSVWFCRLVSACAIFFFVMPIAIIGGAMIMLMIAGMMGVDSKEMSPRWTLAGTVLVGWFLWRYISPRLKSASAKLLSRWRIRSATSFLMKSESRKTGRA